MEKAKETTSIATVVSLDGSSKDELKIVMLHTDSSTATVTELVSITRAGINHIRAHGWSKMFETSGLKAIVEQKESGSE